MRNTSQCPRAPAMLGRCSWQFLWGGYRKVLKHVSYTEMCLGLQGLATFCHSTKFHTYPLQEVDWFGLKESLGTSTVNGCFLVPSSTTLNYVLNCSKILAIWKIVTLEYSFSQSPANDKALFHDGIERSQKNKCQKSAENELENSRCISHEERLYGLEVLERQERYFRWYSIGLSYFPFDERYITSPRKLYFKGNGTSLSLPYKSQLGTKQKMRNHYLLRENDETSISQGNAHISKEEKSLMCSHIDRHSKEKLKADGVRE